MNPPPSGSHHTPEELAILKQSKFEIEQIALSNQKIAIGDVDMIALDKKKIIVPSHNPLKEDSPDAFTGRLCTMRALETQGLVLESRIKLFDFANNGDEDHTGVPLEALRFGGGKYVVIPDCFQKNSEYFVRLFRIDDLQKHEEDKIVSDYTGIISRHSVAITLSGGYYQVGKGQKIWVICEK